MIMNSGHFLIRTFFGCLIFSASAVFCTAQDVKLSAPAGTDSGAEAAESSVKSAAESDFESDSVWRSKPAAYWESVLKKALSNSKRKPPIREQWYAAYALGKYGPSAESSVPVLLERLALEAGSDDDVRACIVFSLAQIGDDRAFPEILAALNSEYPIIERTAALALARFPEKLAKSTEALEKMKSVLAERSGMQLPLASNCAAALWAAGEQKSALGWIQTALRSDREDDFTRNFEIYLALSAVQQILMTGGTDAFSDDSDALASQLVETAAASRDTDVILAACDALTALGAHAAAPVRDAFSTKENARLLYVLACTDAASPQTQTLLFQIAADEEKSAKLRTSAIRGLALLPSSCREEAVKTLVAVINAPEITPALASEAQIALKKLQ